MNRLLLTLRYFATGSFLVAVGDFSGVSKASAGRFIKLVSEALARLRPIVVRFPRQLDDVKEAFYRVARFPSVIGAIDCTHIQIKSPGKNAAAFRNPLKCRKGANSRSIDPGKPKEVKRKF